MSTTPGHQAVIRYVLETVPGTTPTDPALKLFSTEVQRIKFGIDRNQKESRDIGSMDVHEYYFVANSYACEVEMHVADMARLADFFTRASDNSVRSYTLELIPNRDAGVGAVTYFRGRGWKPNSANLKGDAENAYVATIVFEGGVWDAPSFTIPTVGAGSREDPATFTDAVKLFSDGAIALDATPWATLLGSIDFTVTNGIKVHRNTGSKEPVVAVSTSGPRTISGKCDISMDAGFKTQWDRVTAGAAHVLTVPFGGTGAVLLTVSGVRFPKLDPEIGVDTDLLMGNQEFSATSLAFGTVP